jgi:hypothetical protein
MPRTGIPPLPSGQVPPERVHELRLLFLTALGEQQCNWFLCFPKIQLWRGSTSRERGRRAGGLMLPVNANSSDLFAFKGCFR